MRKEDLSTVEKEIAPLKDLLTRLRAESKVSIGILFGSLASGKQHKRSDIDLALYINPFNEKEQIEIIDKILMTVDRDVSILRLDDEDESPFVVQEALKGIHLVEPDINLLYKIAHRVLHESEELRFRRELIGKHKA